MDQGAHVPLKCYNHKYLQFDTQFDTREEQVKRGEGVLDIQFEAGVNWGSTAPPIGIHCNFPKSSNSSIWPWEAGRAIGGEDSHPPHSLSHHPSLSPQLWNLLLFGKPLDTCVSRWMEVTGAWGEGLQVSGRGFGRLEFLLEASVPSSRIGQG